MTPATAYLSFSLHRAAQVDLQGDRRELARCASGVHGDEASALAYARREGPALVLTPAGEVVRVERQRDAAEDLRIAREERAAAEQRRLQPAERWQTAPRFRTT
ncbi:hypothetical protein OV079_23675 [Nannocystis pusilla]|uniref:Uncharacterized protein n=1 Tax=Nannocystis pusilla TaxID=889268 RepID=A0A9X3IXJ2_9BACT|nr:hypothetical protein [Nannocystis pusilla]MCY1003975.1 hypothetical protein [Nannocystis pusilla]MCY1008502.1 hypothetical protein [Nannocystis pusilla]